MVSFMLLKLNIHILFKWIHLQEIPTSDSIYLDNTLCIPNAQCMVYLHLGIDLEKNVGDISYIECLAILIST